MSEEINEVHIKTYDEWLKYYKNATKEQVIEDLTQDVQYFADAVKDIKDLQQKVEQLEKENNRLNNIINELEKWLNEYYKSNRKWYNAELSNHDKQYYEEIYRNTEFMIVKFLKQLKKLKENK